MLDNDVTELRWYVLRKAAYRMSRAEEQDIVNQIRMLHDKNQFLYFIPWGLDQHEAPMFRVYYDEQAETVWLATVEPSCADTVIDEIVLCTVVNGSLA